MSTKRVAVTIFSAASDSEGKPLNFTMNLEEAERLQDDFLGGSVAAGKYKTVGRNSFIAIRLFNVVAVHLGVPTPVGSSRSDPDATE